MALKNRAGIWYVRFKLKGQPVEKSTGLAAVERNRTAAMERERQLRAELRVAIANGDVPKKAGAPLELEDSFSSSAEQFLQWCKTEHRAKPNTWKRIGTSLASLKVFFSNAIVSEIHSGDVDAYKTWRAQTHQVRDVTIRHDLDNLSLFFQWATRARLCSGNPVKEVKRPSDAESIRMHILTDEEERLYLDAAQAASEDLHDLAVIMLNQGCRPEEVMELAPINLLEATGKLRIFSGKTPAARRTLDLTMESLLVLMKRKTRAQSTGSPWLFPSDRIQGQHIVKLNGAHDRALSLINQPLDPDGQPLEPREPPLNFVLYDFRHTFATRMATGTPPCPLPTLAAILGHSGLRMVMRYVHPGEEDKGRAMRAYEAGRRAIGGKSKDAVASPPA